jgi:hypothetical protein
MDNLLYIGLLAVAVANVAALAVVIAGAVNRKDYE